MVSLLDDVQEKASNINSLRESKRVWVNEFGKEIAGAEPNLSPDGLQGATLKTKSGDDIDFSWEEVQTDGGWSYQPKLSAGSKVYDIPGTKTFRDKLEGQGLENFKQQQIQPILRDIGANASVLTELEKQLN